MILLFVFLFNFSLAAVFHRPNIYDWLERNSYICFLELHPTARALRFLQKDEFKSSQCECGDPLETGSACAHSKTQLPFCVRLPELCMQSYSTQFTLANDRLKPFTTTTMPTTSTTEFASSTIEQSNMKQKWEIKTTGKKTFETPQKSGSNRSKSVKLDRDGSGKVMSSLMELLLLEIKEMDMKLKLVDLKRKNRKFLDSK